VARVPSIFDRPVRVLEVPDPMPPAWVVGGARTAASRDDTMRALADDGFDPSREVVLGPRSPAHPASPGFRGRCAIVERGADRLVLDGEARGDGHVVVAEASQRGWRAAVDGAAAEVEPANLLFRSVAVPAGRHRVELRYRPASAGAGAALSVLGLVGLAVLVRPGR